MGDTNTTSSTSTSSLMGTTPSLANQVGTTSPTPSSNNTLTTLLTSVMALSTTLWYSITTSSASSTSGNDWATTTATATTVESTTVTCTWQAWGSCSASCGPSGSRERHCMIGSSVEDSKTEPCNRLCYNDGTLTESYCICPHNWQGTCCNLGSSTGVSLSMSATDVIVFTCDLQYQPSSPDIHYEYTWLVNDAKVHEESITVTTKAAALSEDYWQMGSTIMCKVNIFDHGINIGNWSSDSFFAGIKVTSPPVIELYENDDDVSIQLESTVPFVCDGALLPPYYPCTMSVPIAITDRTLWYSKFSDVVVRDGCGPTFTPTNSQGVHTIYLKAKRDFFDDGDGENILTFPKITTPYSKVWNGYKLDDTIQIRTYDRDRNSRMCCGSGDPHYTTFDNTYFHIFSPGEYIFYRHKFLPYEIQTRLRRCGSVACNCGVAVRAEDDIIIIDRCQSQRTLVVYYWWGRRYSYYRDEYILNIQIIANGQMTPGFRLIRMQHGYLYKIYLPTGGIVEVRDYGYMDVCFSPGTDDYAWENTGLCGSYDGNSENDLLHRQTGSSGNIYSSYFSTLDYSWGWWTLSIPRSFSTSWRVPYQENLFYGKLRPVTRQNTVHQYCTCSQGYNSDGVEDNCYYGRDIARSYLPYPWYPWWYCSSYWCDLTDQHLWFYRKKRQTDDGGTVTSNDDEEPFVFEYEEDDSSTAPSWPTDSGITEMQATDACKSQITDSPSGQKCDSALDEKEVDDLMANCIADIQIFDDLLQAKSAGSMLQTQCAEVVSKNSTFWEDTGDGNGTFAPPTSIIDVLCPSDCNSRGNCSGGVCNCTEGFAGNDCSIDLNDAPDVYKANKNGKCDVRKDSCSLATIRGMNFVESKDLTCHVLRVEISEEGFTILENITKNIEGIYQTFEEVQCSVESALGGKGAADNQTDGEAAPLNPSGALVSVSNDGERASPQVLVVIHDSRCDECNGTEGYCVRKTDICIVDGECYDLADSECQTNVTTAPGSDKQAIIIGSVVGTLAAIGVVALIVFLYKYVYAKKAAKVSPKKPWTAKSQIVCKTSASIGTEDPMMITSVEDIPI